MFKRLSDSLDAKFSRKTDLAKQLEIVKVFDIYKKEIRKLFSDPRDVKLISLKQKKLVVQASSSAMAGELRLYEEAIIEKINETMKRKLVERIMYRF